jgi:hypothetical protein
LTIYSLNYIIALDDALFSKLKKSAVAPYLKAVKELNVDFIGTSSASVSFQLSHLLNYIGTILAFEQQVFSLEQPLSPFHLYNPESTIAQTNELNRISKRVCIFVIDT